VQKNPLNYDNWFDFVRLEEAHGETDKVRTPALFPSPEFHSQWKLYSR
jgi:hypothetical protein